MHAAGNQPGFAMFGTELPIVLGPMSGGPSTPALAAVVSNAGGLGSLGVGYLPPDQIRRDIRAVKDLTDRPFAINLFVPNEAHVEVDLDQVDRALRALAPYRAELGLPPQSRPDRVAEDFGDQLQVVMEENVPVFTVTFGVLAPAVVESFQRTGTLVGGTATTPAEAEALAGCGMDFIVAQGSEAGGHRGSFLSAPGDDLIGTAALVPQVRDATRLPVVAAGGIMDGRGVKAAMALGASAAQLGTAFLLCPEAGTSAPYRDALRRARADDTVITAAFSGRRARGIVNRFTRDFADYPEIPPYPVMNALTRELRTTAAAKGDPEFLSLWAGQGVGLIREMPAAQLVAVLAEEVARS